MASTAAGLRRRTRAGTALAIAVAGLLALAGLAAAGAVTAASGSSAHGDHAPFSFD
jgi:hypothetical protein